MPSGRESRSPPLQPSPGTVPLLQTGATWIPGSAVDRHRPDGLSRPLPSGACDVQHEAPEPTTSSFGATEPGVAGEGTVSAPCFFQAFPLLRSPHFPGLGGDVACQVSLWRPVLNAFPWGGPFTCHSPERVVSQNGPRWVPLECGGAGSCRYQCELTRAVRKSLAFFF